jgi:glycosyltransferase involved in cell wall biosynthesis
MSHPRVLHLIGSLEPGGTERQLVGFIRRSSDPDRHLVAVFSRLGPLADELPTPPTVVGPMDRSLGGVPSGLRTTAALRRVVRRSSPDIVHAHLGYSEVLALAGVPRRVPVVASRRGLTPALESSVAGRVALGLAHRRERVLICNSADLARRARAERACPETVVIPNGVDLSAFTPITPFEGPPTVVVVARLRKEKGHDRFLRAFRSVLDRMPEAQAVIVGDGPARPEVETLLRVLDLGSAVHLAGEVADPRLFLAAANVVALTSPHEGFPNALLEAMASGRPVVATAVGGVPELVTDGEDGLLVAPDDGAVAEALLRLLRDPAEAARLGKEARRTAERYEWSDVVDRTEAVYRRVLGLAPIAAGVSSS